MRLNNKYLKTKKGVRDLEIVVLGERYFINPQMLPFIAARVFKDNNIYAFIVVNKRGVAQFLRPGDTLALLSICTFRNASTKEELAKNADIPSCMIDDNNNFYPMKSIKEVIGNTSTAKVVQTDGKKVDTTIRSVIEKPGERNKRSFSYSGEEDTRIKVGYKDGFSMDATVPEEIYPIIESKYIELKKKYSDKFNVKLTFLSRTIDKDKNIATVTFRFESVIKSPDWIVLGTIYHHDDKNVVEPMVKVSQETLDVMFKLPCKCDICGERRDRTKTYYIQNLKDRSRFIQAAAHCMDKVIGINTLAASEDFENLLKLIKSDDWGEYRKEGANYFNSLDIFATTYLNLSWGGDEIAKRYSIGCYDDLDSKSRQLVDDAIKWINRLDSSIELFRNVQTLLKCNNTHKRFIPKYRKIWKLYLQYVDYKTSNDASGYKAIVDKFNKLKSDIVRRIDSFDRTKAEYTEYNDKLRLKLEGEMKAENEKRRAEYEQKKKDYEDALTVYNKRVEESKSRYERELAAYNEYLGVKDTLSLSELLKFEQELTDRYNLKSTAHMREFKTETWIRVRVKKVELKLVMDNQYGEGKVGPYVFTTDEGFKISWFTQLDKAKELGLPQDKGEVLELDKVLRCKTKKYIEKYGELQVAYCKFVDDKPESLIGGHSLFDKAPEPQWENIRAPKEPSCAQNVTISYFVGEADSFKNIDKLVINNVTDLAIKDSIMGVDPETFYDIEYINVKEKYANMLNKFFKGTSATTDIINEAKENIKSFDISSIIVLDLRTYGYNDYDSYVTIYESNYGYVYRKDTGNYMLNCSPLLEKAIKAQGIKIKVKGLRMKNFEIYDIVRVRTDKGVENLYQLKYGKYELYLNDVLISL